METIFFHSLRQQSTTASGSSFFFNWNIFLSQCFISASKNEFFFFLTVFFIPNFFLLIENITEISEETNVKDEPYSCRWTLIFFDFFEILLKVEAVLLYSKSVFFNILYPASGNEFSAYGNIIFLVRAILLLSEIISVMKR